MIMRQIDFKDKLVLAPIAGYTDKPFRDLAVYFEADIVYTEMVSSLGLANADEKTKRLIDISDYESQNALVGVQIFGNDEESLKRSVDYLNSNEKISIIDLNIGCPAPKVVKNGSGSALLRDPEKIYKLLSAMKSESDKALTAKIRLGINGLDNYLEVAKAAEEAGINALAVHGRTREQMYEGKANWDKILEIKDALDICVIGNGDIDYVDLAMSRLEDFDSIMIARGALGNPWIFRYIKEMKSDKTYNPLSIEEKFDVFIKHLDSSVEAKGEKLGVIEMRKHLHSYLKGMRNSSEVKNYINTLTSHQELKEELLNYKNTLLTLQN